MEWVNIGVNKHPGKQLHIEESDTNRTIEGGAGVGHAGGHRHH